ncbi:ABC transporter permease [Emticicia agri]|uniref:FtsX-like permease family protein n=1 Tax=Emticicia agri TaxID=2492393 RepID=A0A4Q5M508_9BACT|nr:ABC transporter permease [Emticicia agri]RYU97576.1 FtsX-like permease family protein [Emticicia agri]
MIKNYLKIAFRNLVKNKVFSAINVLGLAIGIATCLIIMLFVQDELSFDRYNEKADRIVRVVFKGMINGEEMKEAVTMAPTASTLKNDYQEVEDATRLRTYGYHKIVVGEKTFKDGNLAYVDANFFQIFTLPLIKGDAKTALLEPNTVVITQAMANKYFGNEDPIGKVLTFKDWKQVYKVTGVIEKVPANSHFHFDLFGSMTSLEDAKGTSWMESNYFSYLLLRKGQDYQKLESKLPLVVEKYVAPQLQKALGVTLSEFRKKGNDIRFHLQPLTDIHLHSDFSVSIEPGGDVRYVYIFGAIAIFMILIACINFMNLSTAGASKRAKEVGIRKVLGSVKYELIGQFLLESVMLTFFALLLALVIVKIALPLFNDLSGKELILQFNNYPLVITGLVLFGLLVSLLAGSYPAFFLSSFKPASVLKSKFMAAGKTIGLRSGLVVFQFMISIALIIGTTIVYQQLAYIQSKKLGYNKDQLLVLRNSWALGQNELIFRDQLMKDPRVLNVTVSGYLPVGPTNNNMSGTYPDEKVNQNRRTIIYQVDDQYIPTMGMELVSGRNFSKEFATDSSGVIINETVAKIYGWGKDAVGHTINRFIDNQGNKKAYKVIGVVKDFHFRSLHEEIAPLVMVLENNSGLIVKVKAQDIPTLLKDMKSQWAAFKVEEPFDYGFLDEFFNKTYMAEQKTGVILGIFTGLTIFIACLGLFGLATFTAEQRIKEIGIRKVLGANVSQIVILLSIDFVKLILIACLIAFPLGYWGMDKWLQDFAYKVDINWPVFVLAGVSAIAVALVTISFQAIKAALMNPIKSLKTE